MLHKELMRLDATSAAAPSSSSSFPPSSAEGDCDFINFIAHAYDLQCSSLLNAFLF